MRRLLLVAYLGLGVGGLGLGAAGCVSDPNDPKTWIKKLDDPREGKDAVRMLVKLKNKQAVGPLVDLYKKTGDRDQLKAIASFAEVLQGPDALAERGQAVEIFKEALDFNEGSEESVDRASVAATALGELGDKAAVDALIKTVGKTLPIKTRANVVKLEAMKSLAKLKDARAVDALVKVLQTSADEQDFFLNKSAAKSLAEFGDPKAAPALVRGLFMTGRRSDIFQECRTALLAIGEPAVEPVVEAMQRKNADLEADAKKYMFYPGIIVQKTAMILGDLRSKKAVPALLDELKKEDEGIKAGEGKGVSGHRDVLSALGRIGDPSVQPTLEAIAKDPKAPKAKRLGAFDGLWQLGNAGATATLLPVAKASFIGKDNMVDGSAAELAMFAATSYSRLVGPDGVAEIQKVPEEIVDAAEVFGNVNKRVAVAKECKADAACYEKYLDKNDTAQAEKAASALWMSGKAALPVLLKHMAAPDPAARLMVLFGVGRLADKGNKDVLAALDKQIETDDKKPALAPVVHEMRALRALLSH